MVLCDVIIWIKPTRVFSITFYSNNNTYPILTINHNSIILHEILLTLSLFFSFIFLLGLSFLGIKLDLFWTIYNIVAIDYCRRGRDIVIRRCSSVMAFMFARRHVTCSCACYNKMYVIRFVFWSRKPNNHRDIILKVATTLGHQIRFKFKTKVFF